MHLRREFKSLSLSFSFTTLSNNIRSNQPTLFYLFVFVLSVSAYNDAIG